MTSLLMHRRKKRKLGLGRDSCRKKWFPSRRNWSKYRRNTDRHVSNNKNKTETISAQSEKCNLQLKDQVSLDEALLCSVLCVTVESDLIFH